MDKAKITREQEKRIRLWKEGFGLWKEGFGLWKEGFGNPSKLLERHAKHLLSKSKCLRSLTLDELARAIYVGYEVEEEFKVGNWIVTKTGYIGEIEYINSVEKWANVGYRKETERRGVCLAKTFNIAEIERHATPEEIAEEKERRWWNSHGRGVWELREGDILSTEIRFSCYVKIVEYSDMGCTILVGGNEIELLETKDKLKEKYTVLCFVENRLDGETNE